MTGYTNFAAQGTQNHWVGKTSLGSAPTVSIALFTAVGSDSGSGFTEMTGNGYSRVTTSGVTWNAASGTSPSFISNAADIQFPTASGGSWTALIALGAFDNSIGGNLLWWDYLGNYPWLPFTCTLASPGVITAPLHGYSNSDSAVVTAEYGGTLPSTGGSWAGLLTVAGVSGDTFNLGVNTTSTGNGSVRKVQSVTVPNGSTFVFQGGTPGNLLFYLA